MSLQNFSKKLGTVKCSKDTTAEEIAEMMKSKNVGTVLVEDEQERPLGIVTDRDLVVRCLITGADCADVTAEEVMSSPVQTIDQDASILDLIEEMASDNIRRLCVVDDAGKTVGMISMADVFELLAHEMGQLSKALGRRHEKLFRRVRGAA